MATQFNFEAIGTAWQIDIYDELSPQEEIPLYDDIISRIAVFDAHYSRFREDSLVADIARTKGQYSFPEDAEVLFDLYKKLYSLTDGSVTPLIGQVLVDAGYDAHYSLIQKGPLRHPKKWQEVIDYTHPVLTTQEPVLLDFGAAGKGYLIDIVAGLLDQEGIEGYCIDAGGDIIHKGHNVLRVGLEHPSDSKKVIGVVHLQNKSLCGSAGNRRAWQGFHHIMDPHTLTSAQSVVAVWVTAESTIIADGVATALFFVTPEKLSATFDFEYVIVHADYSVQKSAQFPGEIF